MYKDDISMVLLGSFHPFNNVKVVDLVQLNCCDMMQRCPFLTSSILYHNRFARELAQINNMLNNVVKAHFGLFGCSL
jgi:hypothetical protein